MKLTATKNFERIVKNYKVTINTSCFDWSGISLGFCQVRSYVISMSTICIVDCDVTHSGQRVLSMFNREAVYILIICVVTTQPLTATPYMLWFLVLIPAYATTT